MKALSPYAEQAGSFRAYTSRTADGCFLSVRTNEQTATYISPSFQFLSRFHRLNRVRVADKDYHESRKNTQLQEAYQVVSKDRDHNARALLAGIANVIEQDEAPSGTGGIPRCETACHELQDYP